MIDLIPSSVLEILEALERAGHRAYLVGGSVRDLLMHKIPKDWDICTSSLPEQTKEIFPSHIALGERYGTIGVKVEEGIVEVTTFRQEEKYLDFRHPEVSFVQDLQTDLERRDFTINAMAYHPREGIIDLFDGVQDLQNQVLRCVGDGGVRFQEDALRILRLVRFSCTLGFSPQSHTLSWAIHHRTLIGNLAKERISQELLLILQGEFLDQFFETYCEIFAEVLPKLRKPKKRKIRNLSLLLAYLFDEDSVLDLLCLDKEQKKRARVLIQYKRHKISADSIEIKLLLRDIGYDYFMALIELKKLLGEEIKMFYRIAQQIMIDDECFCLKDLKIKGYELQKMGFSGVKIGEILECLLEEVIRGETPNTLEALRQRAIYFSRI
ncbi:CCA tRNA nucleotidyltransferase [Helicobacter pametensis]|uniref:CCA tRNA nucleotidyltransferase n=1 Tax=Helicobacter pametensis TaxID=95149 RepID=UPI0004B49FBA|nr:hypothetical protein [Helicobacter pametensis]